MRRIIRIPRILWRIGVPWTVISQVMEAFGIPYPPVLRWLYLLCLFVFLDIDFWIGSAQILGSLFAKLTYRSKLPSDGNYDCAVDYILPFAGKWTVFNGGIGKGMSHSWSIVAQRYAYDFIIMDETGKSFAGDNTRLESYYCYGKDVIAPADGRVVKISSKHRDSRVSGEKVYCDTWDIRGNFVVIKHAAKEYSVFAHLLPGSITVGKGDQVRQGQVIAKCGNSGNTSEPHLHYQLQSGKSFFTSAGLPISFVGIQGEEKTNYGMADPRSAQKKLMEASGDGRVYIGRGLEVENGKGGP
ncbi:MAG: M23 family metallopeptidase [Oscillospiraceae bacterium]|nr:M23 family metallopeptidase [Oscillospiraceae bacterium]